MKVIIRESRIKELGVKWLQTKYPDLVEEVSERSISYIEPSTNTTVFSFHDGLVIFYKDIYTTFNQMFGLSEKEITHVIQQWVIDYYGFDVKRVVLFLK
jgi:hypothetical protein